MNGMIDRKLLAECIILLVVCVGAWLMIVRPKRNQLAGLETQIAHARSDPARESRGTVEQMAARLDDVRYDVRNVIRQNELGRDSSRMYGLIMELAKLHDVSVGRLDPGDRRESGATKGITRTSFSMSVSGRFRQVAAFLEGILKIDGFVRPGSLTLAPDGVAGANALVTAQFSCQTLSFDVPSALVSIVGDGHADQ